MRQKNRINSEGVYQWTEQDFTQLYPEAPSITTSSTFFIVALNYRGMLLKVKLPTGIETKNLAYIFHRKYIVISSIWEMITHFSKLHRSLGFNPSIRIFFSTTRYRLDRVSSPRKLHLTAWSMWLMGDLKSIKFANVWRLEVLVRFIWWETWETGNFMLWRWCLRDLSAIIRNKISSKTKKQLERC